MTATMHQAVREQTLSPQDRETALKASEDIRRCMNGETCYSLELMREGEKRVEVKIPALALSLLVSILEEMGKGNAVTTLPIPVELTEYEAAGIMGVSHTYFIKLLDEEKIPFRTVGTLRKIRYDELDAYMEAKKVARKAVLNEMVAEAQRLRLYE